MLFGNTTGCWKSIPMQARKVSTSMPGAWIERPWNSTSPLTLRSGVRSTKRFRHLSKVLLPAPDGPIRPKTWWGGTARFTLRKSHRVPARTASPLTSRSAGFAAGMAWHPSVMPRLLMDLEPQGQRDEAHEYHEPEQHERATPELRTDRRIKGILRKDKDMVGQRQHGAVLDAVRYGCTGEDRCREHDGRGFARSAREAKQGARDEPTGALGQDHRPDDLRFAQPKPGRRLEVSHGQARNTLDQRDGDGRQDHDTEHDPARKPRLAPAEKLHEYDEAEQAEEDRGHAVQQVEDSGESL